VSISPEASFLYGDVDGFVQIPRGGQPGTTSSKRPTFDELGIGGVPMADVSVAGGVAGHQIYVGARIVEASGDATLTETLTSHGTSRSWHCSASRTTFTVPMRCRQAGLSAKGALDSVSDRASTSVAASPSPGR
jgi:hypothetical protein